MNAELAGLILSEKAIDISSDQAKKAQVARDLENVFMIAQYLMEYRNKYEHEILHKDHEVQYEL